MDEIKKTLIRLIREQTGNPKADLWTLKFDENDANATKEQIADPYVNGIPIKTKNDVIEEAKYCCQ